MKVLDWSYPAIRWVLGSVFIYSGGVKLLDPITFAVLIEAYGLVPDCLLLPVAVILAGLEVVAGVGLFFDVRGSLSVITSLLALFIAILGYGIRMGSMSIAGASDRKIRKPRRFTGSDRPSTGTW